MIWVDTIPIVLYLETIKTQFYSLLKYLSLVFGRFSIEISSHYFSPPSNAINIKILFDVNHSPVKILNKTRKTYEKTWSVLVQTVLAIFFSSLHVSLLSSSCQSFPFKICQFFFFQRKSWEGQGSVPITWQTKKTEELFSEFFKSEIWDFRTNLTS
jgi:hypothetical protein